MRYIGHTKQACSSPQAWCAHQVLGWPTAMGGWWLGTLLINNEFCQH